MKDYLTSPFLVRIWSGRILWNCSELRAFAHEAREEIRGRHPKEQVAHIEFVRYAEWPFVVLDVKYQLEGEGKERYLRSTAFERELKHRAGNLPIA